MIFYTSLRSKCCYVYLLISFTIINASSQSPLDSVRNTLYNPTFSDSIKANNALKISNYFIGRSEDSARYYNALAMDIAKEIQAEELLLNIQLSEIDVYRHQWSFDTLDMLYTKVLNLAEKGDYQTILLDGLISHSALHNNRGQYEEGIEILLKAIPIAEKLGNYSKLGKTEYNLAACYANMNMNELAIDKLRNAYMSFIKGGEKELSLIALNSTANCFNNLDQKDSAFHYLNIILPIADSIDYTRLQVGARSTYGAMLLSDKKYIEAKKVFDEALPIAEKMGNTLTIGNCHCNLGRVNYYLGNYKDALNHLNTAYALEVFKDNKLASHFCLKEMAMTQKKLGNHQIASEYFEEYVQYQDTVLLKENKLIIAELEEKYAASKKEAEIKKQEVEIQQKTYQRNMLLGGMSLSVLLGGAIIWGLFSRNNRNKKLAAQDKKLQIQKIQNLEKEKKLLSMSSLLEGQESERIRIAKDLHDGLGGLLTNVKAHFGKIQAEIEKVENLDVYNTANAMIDKAHEEVRRISHNLMPADLRVGGLPIALRQLIHELRSIHEIKTDFDLIGFNEKRINEKVELSVYRIVQELINNILKYADASEVFVQLSKFEKELQIVVEDNGIGFDYDKALSKKEGLGLKSIQSRVDQLNGLMDVESVKGKGTSVTVNIPLAD